MLLDYVTMKARLDHNAVKRQQTPNSVLVIVRIVKISMKRQISADGDLAVLLELLESILFYYLHLYGFVGSLAATFLIMFTN